MKTQTRHKDFLYGIGFTILIALSGYLLANIPGLHRIGPLACAIILALIYRNIFGYPDKLRSGINFAATYLLRLAIILYGLKLNIHLIFENGIGLIVKSSLVVILSLGLMFFFSKLFKADKQLSLLLAIGTGICGAAAIAATAPILKSKPDNTAISIAIIALTGTVFSIAYTLLFPVLPLSIAEYATFSGLGLHELAHVALAAEPAGDQALTTALLAKLSRVFLLVPFSFLLIFVLKMKEKGEKTKQTKITYPYFLIGFLLMSIFGSYVLGTHLFISEQTEDLIGFLTTFLLTMAMVGLGLNVDLKAIRTRALRPLGAILLTSLILSVFTYFIV